MRPTRVAVLTASGPGAVAVVRVWGPGALAVADAAFRPRHGSVLTATPPERPRLGRVGAGMGDEVVALIFPNEPDEVEVQCHGGPAATTLVVDALVGAGAELADAPEWVRHAGRSWIQSEAWLDLPHASTLRTAAHLLDQANGALDRELASILDDIPGRPEAAAGRIDALIARGSVGVRLAPGWRVVLAGRPNVGKSRLLNALLGFDRAIVDPAPGTTRDVVTSGTAFDGWPVELADTAGLRATVDPIEAAGVAMSRARQASADLVLLVLDRSEPLNDADRRLMADHPNALAVANKADLPGVWDFDGPVVSAERGDGIDRLAAEIGRRIVPDPPPPGSALPFRPEHVGRLERLAVALRNKDGGQAIRSLKHWLDDGSSEVAAPAQ